MRSNSSSMKIVERHRYKDKEIFQTRTLVFEPYPMSEIFAVMESIRENLSPDLLKGRKSLMFPQDVQKNRFMVIATILPKLCIT